MALSCRFPLAKSNTSTKSFASCDNNRANKGRPILFSKSNQRLDRGPEKEGRIVWESLGFYSADDTHSLTSRTRLIPRSNTRSQNGTPEDARRVELMTYFSRRDVFMSHASPDHCPRYDRSASSNIKKAPTNASKSKTGEAYRQKLDTR
jgi:hypothetical protein